MRKRTDYIALIAVTILFNYAIAIGTTFNGILTPELHTPSLILITLTVVGWLFVHWRRGWVWYRSPLDVVILLWVLSFVLSLVANIESWRRIAIGLWYVGGYIGVWYLLHDMLANQGSARELLVDGLLIAGAVVLFFGIIQSRNWFTDSLPLILSGVISFNLPRPVSTFGNPNTLANFLVVLIPFALTRALAARVLIGRIVMALYALLALLLLLLTFSRGAWIGMAAGVSALAVLLLARRNMLSRTSLWEWWRGRRPVAQVILVAVSLIGIIVCAAILIVFLRSFQEVGRSAGLRSEIYTTAITMFTEKPFFGHGLFTFGRGLSRLQSVPPTTPHSHAHNAPLLIGAELGLLGLVALFATLAVMAWAAFRNWRDMNDRQRITLSAAIAAVIAFAVHQLTDVAATTPAIVLSGLVALALMVTPAKPFPSNTAFRRLAYPMALSALWAILLVMGFWSSQVYTTYAQALLYASESQDFRGAAASIQSAIDADPALSIHYKEQGFLLGLAAYEGSAESARDAIAAYREFLAQEPDYAIVWANMAALQWELGERDAALESMRRAVLLAPESWQLAVNLGNYAAELDEMDVAQQAYAQAVEILPDIILMPELGHLFTEREHLELTTPAQVVTLLNKGEVSKAAEVWSKNPPRGSSSKYTIDLLLALAGSDRSGATKALLKAERAVFTETDQAWVHVARARLARFDGDNVSAQAELDAAQELLKREIFEGDFLEGINIALAQFLRTGIPRQFLPQVYFPVGDPVLLHLISTT